jgi:hypothetical protein
MPVAATPARAPAQRFLILIDDKKGDDHFYLLCVKVGGATNA